MAAAVDGGHADIEMAEAALVAEPPGGCDGDPANEELVTGSPVALTALETPGSGGACPATVEGMEETPSEDLLQRTPGDHVPVVMFAPVVMLEDTAAMLVTPIDVDEVLGDRAVPGRGRSDRRARRRGNRGGRRHQKTRRRIAAGATSGSGTPLDVGCDPPVTPRRSGPSGGQVLSSSRVPHPSPCTPVKQRRPVVNGDERKRRRRTAEPLLYALIPRTPPRRVRSVSSSLPRTRPDQSFGRLTLVESRARRRASSSHGSSTTEPYTPDTSPPRGPGTPATSPSYGHGGSASSDDGRSPAYRSERAAVRRSSTSTVSSNFSHCSHCSCARCRAHLRTDPRWER